MHEAQILLVDDEVDFVEVIAKRLRRRNFEVREAFSGEAAIDELERHPYTDVVILDVKMPGKDGLETLKEIRGQHPLVEVIMLTGHATVESAIEGMKLGAFDYLVKPCEMDVLLKKVREAKKKKDAHEQKILQARSQEIANRRGD